MRKNNSIVITGGAGMLGLALARAMRRRDQHPVSIERSKCDITDDALVARLFEKHRPSVLLNCAAYTQVDAAERDETAAMEVNGHAVERLARFARRFETRLIHFSTDFVFDGKSRRPYQPGDKPNPIGAYARSKLLGENLLQAVAPPGWLIVRSAWLFGQPGKCFPKAILDAARAGKTLRVVNDQSGSPTHVDDLAEMTLELVDRSAEGVFHIAGGGITNWFEFARAVLQQFHVPAEVLPISTAEWLSEHPGAAVRPSFSVLDSSAAELATGHSVKHWQQALGQFRSDGRHG